MVLTTSASSGPLGSEARPVTALPSGVVTDGIGCSAGEGKASVMISSSSSMPIFCGAEATSTG